MCESILLLDVRTHNSDRGRTRTHEPHCTKHTHREKIQYAYQIFSRRSNSRPRSTSRKNSPHGPRTSWTKSTPLAFWTFEPSTSLHLLAKTLVTKIRERQPIEFQKVTRSTIFLPHPWLWSSGYGYCVHHLPSGRVGGQVTHGFDSRRSGVCCEIRVRTVVLVGYDRAGRKYNT